MKILNTLSDNALIELLNSGAVGVLPTDTVYGLVCRAADESAVKRLYELKNRENKPGTIVAASMEQLTDLGVKARYVKAVEKYWVDGLSVVLPTGFDLGYLHLGKLSLACRVVHKPELVKLLRQTGPLLTTSANQPGESPAKNIDEATGYFGDTVDFYVEVGTLAEQMPSTIIRVVDDAVEILREGAVKIDEATGKIL